MVRLLDPIRELARGTDQREPDTTDRRSSPERTTDKPEQTTDNLKLRAERMTEGLQSGAKRAAGGLSSGTDRTSGTQRAYRGLVKKGLLFLGVLTAAYAASRYQRSGEAALPDEDLSPGTPSEDPFSEATLSEDDPSTEEIEARAEPDVTDEPAEPGEMNVDEDVVDDIVDEESEDEERT